MIICEDNWTRYLDYLYDLPTNTTMWFEYGDPKLIKEKLGKKHIIKGLFPLTMLKSSTKQQCIDKARELIDILAPGGKYMFLTEKHPLSINDINIDNLAAVTQFVRNYGVYNNVGETAGLVFKQEDYKSSPSRKLESKYYTLWEEFRSKYPMTSDFGFKKLQGLEDTIFIYLTGLLL